MFSLYLYQTWNKYDMQWFKNYFFSFCAIIKENLIFKILIKFMETHSATWWTSFYSSSEFSNQTGEEYGNVTPRSQEYIIQILAHLHSPNYLAFHGLSFAHFLAVVYSCYVVISPVWKTSRVIRHMAFQYMCAVFQISEIDAAIISSSQVLRSLYSLLINNTNLCTSSVHNYR